MLMVPRIWDGTADFNTFGMPRTVIVVISIVQSFENVNNKQLYSSS